ncbi:hypothetical protein UDX32_05390 [Serratia marcescens]|uniref:hypothetical protein n=1 Tax=Serratia marcescens TaxID=615 RepID=UPI000C13550C|nr:hypothetical protein [Serratia marcescens]PHY71096.1 hypothetical protein CS366_16670 [Serratia marcescens]PIC06736.1 hypothetical protein CS367_01000 [Serratia marcescens]CAI2080647.1 Uncharacterised protein [Serratia marcescens]HAT2876978.1 hypothetical protein [Serratia marcescens]HAT2887424.1 hypothetical protein [Serratia marcescens]
MIIVIILNSIDAVAAVGTKVRLEVRGGKIKKVRRQPDLEELTVLIEWAGKTLIDGIRIRDYLIHIPNEGKRGPKKLQGMRNVLG